MKKDFFDYVLTLMKSQKNLWFLSAGLGYPRTEELKEQFPTRFLQCEASEQATMQIAVGLAYAGKIPIVYSITPFLLYRPFETIRTYINHESLPVVLVGAGRNDDYSKHDGFSHDATDDSMFMQFFENIESAYPDTVSQMQRCLRYAVKAKRPYYLNIPR